MKIVAATLFFLLSYPIFAQGRTLDLPPRRANALSGSEFAKSIEHLGLEPREDQIFAQVEQGNVPDFLRQFVPVEMSYEGLKGEIFVLPDYLAVGTNDDYFLVPMTPYTAQRIADLLHCTLPTPQMADAIDRAAQLKLEPTPIPPTAAMTTVPEFEQINQMVNAQRKIAIGAYPLGTLTVGDKKDIVICKGLAQSPGKVAIYGWYRLNGKPIQPLYLGHTASWADYSHGVRLISDTMEINGQPCKVEDVLQDPARAGILSGEGVLTQPRYVFKAFPKDWSETIMPAIGQTFGWFSPIPGVRALIDEPVHLISKIRLVLYALPNGNTIEETFGKTMAPGDDWHFDIQHIGAQTRFLRQRMKDASLVVVYLQANQKAWPSFLKSQTAGTAVKVVNAVLDIFKGDDISVVFDSHSGGGSLLFDYIRDVDQIPDEIDRIAFLDSEYNYDTALDEAKLTKWLQSGNHFLCAIAYDDASALLDGKPFVSAEGGTWGRTHLMLQDLSREFEIKKTNGGDPARWSGLDGRVVFWLKENPTHQIFHTVQVERNGFIESLLSGTPLEGKDYAYFGDRAYSRNIR